MIHSVPLYLVRIVLIKCIAMLRNRLYNILFMFEKFKNDIGIRTVCLIKRINDKLRRE